METKIVMTAIIFILIMDLIISEQLFTRVVVKSCVYRI